MVKCRHCEQAIAQLSIRNNSKWIGYDGRHYGHPYWYHTERQSFWCDRTTKTEAEPKEVAK